MKNQDNLKSVNELNADLINDLQNREALDAISVDEAERVKTRILSRTVEASHVIEKIQEDFNSLALVAEDQGKKAKMLDERGKTIVKIQSIDTMVRLTYDDNGENVRYLQLPQLDISLLIE